MPQDRAAFGDEHTKGGWHDRRRDYDDKQDRRDYDDKQDTSGERRLGESLPSDRRMDTQKTGLAGMVRGVLILLAIAAGAAGTVSHSAAQDADSDVAYVEAITGRVLASAQGNPTFLDVCGRYVRGDLCGTCFLDLPRWRRVPGPGTHEGRQCVASTERQGSQ